MRNLIFGAFLMLTTLSFAQGSFKAGVNGGIPVGDIEELSKFHIGADVAYMFEVTDVLEIGPLIGYSHFFTEDVEFDTGFGTVTAESDDVQFLPIAASGRFGINDSFFLGADLGYALGIQDGNDGGFYYRPQVGYDFGLIGLILSYEGISVDGGSISSVNLGLEFGL